jgi:TolA-binding protein
MADILRQSEENGHALRSLQADIATARSAQDQRIGAIEQRLNEAPAAAPVISEPAPQPTTAKPASTKPPAGKKAAEAAAPAPAPEGGPALAEAPDPGEDAYTEGFHLWEAGQYDQAITSLRAFTSAYPKHRRVSFANNLIGRALLDKGQPRAAAEALLANYRGNPKGERAADSLYYLGQALMKLGQPGQACKAYQELDAVYGDKARADLKKLVQDAESQAQCG